MQLWSDIVGLVGVGLVLLAYFLLQTGKMSSTDIRYSVLNLLGSIALLISLTQTFNLASVVIEIAWICISLLGLWRALKVAKKLSLTKK